MIAPRLAQYLSDGDGRVRQAAVQALGRLGERAPVERLLQALTDSSRDVRQAAAEALGDLGERAPVEPLVQALADSNAGVRRAAARALGRLGKRAPVEPLVWAMEDSDSSVRLIACSIVREYAPNEILQTASAAERILLRTAADPKEARAFGVLWQVDIITEVGNFGLPHPTFFDILAKSLEWPHWRVKAAAAEALGKIKRHVPSEIIQRLTALRNDPAEMRVVRDACDDALAEILSIDPMEDDL